MNLLTVKEVAALLKIKTSTVYAWAEQRVIPSYKINGALRFSEEDIKAWLDACKLPAEEYNAFTGKRPRKGGIK
jgi:excisionase family DNA binding protein